MRQLALLCAALLACRSAPEARPNRLVPGPRTIIDSTYAVTGIEVDIARLARQLDSLERRDPAGDAREAAAGGDLRLRALRGPPLDLPGVPARRRDRLVRDHGVLVFQLTGVKADTAHGDPVWARWQAAAARYAEAYNRALLAFLRRR
jgi:hypothetical protein